MEMTNNNKQTESTSTEEVTFKMRRSLSWDRAFFTSDGFLTADELSNMIEGGGDDVKYEFQKIKELESVEATLFQEIEASVKKTTGTDLRKKDSQTKKVTGAGGPHMIKTLPTRSSPLSGGGSPGNNIKTIAKRSPSSKSGKGNADSPSKTPPGITTKSKVALVKTRVSRTSPASPVSPGSSDSSASTSKINQRSKRIGSVPHRSPVNNVKPSAINARRKDDLKSSKPAVDLMPKSQSSISLKLKPPPVISNPPSPSRVFNSSSSPTTQRLSVSPSSSTVTVDQKPKARGIKGSTSHISNLASKNQPTSRTSNVNGSKTTKLPSIKTGLKTNSPKTTPPKKQSRSKEEYFVISPEVLDLKGKINALRMEISMQKDRCSKMVRSERSVSVEE